jgi:hypothetical protein
MKNDLGPAEWVSASDASTLLSAGQGWRGMKVRGKLDLAGQVELPEQMTVDHLNISRWDWVKSLPRGLKARRLNVAGCKQLKTLPDDLQCSEILAQGAGLEKVPGLKVGFRIDLSQCHQLVSIGDGLSAPTMILAECAALSILPEGLEASFLDISGCMELSQWPKTGSLSIGRLNMRDCIGLGTLPTWMGPISQLNISGCVGFRTLPEWTQVTSWVDVAGTRLRSLPAGCDGALVRWRGVFINRQIAFEPESITVEQILGERNSEVRRVLLERVGYSRFLKEARAEELDQDKDPGGERRLVRVPMEGDEPLVCVMVKCPSTQRQYVLRVPPGTTTCRQAVAWIAGYDNPDDYKPLIET